MRKFLIALTIGLMTAAAAACGNSGGSVGSDSLDTMAPVQSFDAGASPSDMLESPSDMLESPAAS